MSGLFFIIFECNAVLDYAYTKIHKSSMNLI